MRKWRKKVSVLHGFFTTAFEITKQNVKYLVVNRVAPIIRHNNKNTSIPKNTEEKGSPVTKKNTSTSKRSEDKGGLIQKKLINGIIFVK